MKIEVQDIYLTKSGMYFASVLVGGASGYDEAIKAIESTMTQDMDVKVGILEGMTAELRQQVDHARREVGDLGEENHRLRKANEELRAKIDELYSDLNEIGNGVCELANKLDTTNYVPF